MKIIINNKFKKRFWIITVAVVLIFGGALLNYFVQSIWLDRVTTVLCIAYGALASRLWREK